MLDSNRASARFKTSSIEPNRALTLKHRTDLSRPFCSDRLDRLPSLAASVTFLKALDELGLSNQGKLPTDIVQVRLGFVLKSGHVSGYYYHEFVHFIEKGVYITSIQERFSI